MSDTKIAELVGPDADPKKILQAVVQAHARGEREAMIASIIRETAAAVLKDGLVLTSRNIAKYSGGTLHGSAVFQRLRHRGLVYRYARGRWDLTEAGQRWLGEQS